MTEPHESPDSSGVRSAVPGVAAASEVDSTAPLLQVTPERALWYVETLFAYTNDLMERTQTRCNYLIFSNSVASVAFFTLLNALVTHRSKGHHLVSDSTAVTLALIPAAILLMSLVTAVSAFLPRIYDYKIELNHDFIATMTADQYRAFLGAKSDDSKLTDFIEEIHVLSRILTDRSRRVDIAARLFISGVGLIPIVTACAVV